MTESYTAQIWDGMTRKVELLYELAHNPAVERNYGNESRERLAAMMAKLATAVRAASTTVRLNGG